MIVHITDENWSQTRTYLHERAARFADLTVAAGSSGRRATVHWSVPETAAHVATLSWLCAALVDPGRDPGPFAKVRDLLAEGTVDTVNDFNDTMLRDFLDRDPASLAGSIRDDVDHALTVTKDVDPLTPIPWLGDSRLPAAGLLAHLLNEFQVHGRDIARAARLPWRVPAPEAAPFLEQFLIGVTEFGYGRLLDGYGTAPKGRVSVEFRSEHTRPVVMVLTDGLVTVERPDGAPDVRLTFDPTILNLVLFSRVSKVRAALTGKLVVGGRRPWALRDFLRVVRLPR